MASSTELKQARGVIVIVGRASQEWARARLDECRKLMVTVPGSRRFCGVLLVPPSEANPAAFEHPIFKTPVFDIRQGLTPDTLAPLLQYLGSS